MSVTKKSIETFPSPSGDYFFNDFSRAIGIVENEEYSFRPHQGIIFLTDNMAMEMFLFLWEEFPSPSGDYLI